ncbi:pimeloyl-ACP methyl ester carboxylesterase [Chitinophaga niastensis]|uniref:Pimeloyl-ACP methyl ester carboxylesterase n=1 Tax=Chitinophaga niastensis TaxID=536980 RepID=A0A2P8HGN9_CHINA|nr:alpha/beta hydrolase [Chitinophaga niastensis]PSL45387.1 pimeloyl-ACP methyl ester carboxylesterase [Chitinophaga niastensis]
MKHLFFVPRSKTLLIIFQMILLAGSTTSLFAQTSEISFNVKKEGSGRPMILIPGLYCSGDVWDDAAVHFSKNFECHIITLPGFGGQPPIQSDSLLTTIVRQLAVYIQQNNLKKPVIVGHSLGGWLALKLGILYPELTGDIVCVSCAPFLPALSMGAEMTVEGSREIGMKIKKGIVSQNAAQVKLTQQAMLGSMMRDPDRIAQVAAMGTHSDQATQGEAMYELFSNDLRNSLETIDSRILVLGDWQSYKEYGASHESVYENLKGQFRQARQVKIAISDTSRHFIMFDEPQWFYSQTDDFLQHQ